MTLKLQLPKLTELKPRITVMGIGGAGGNAVNNMIAAGLEGVRFVAANTDAQALLHSAAEHCIQLGMNLTEGLGAGSKPEIGEAAAEEAIEEIKSYITGSHMLFVAAGMGGGTGSGAAAVVARAARELDILVVGIVTKPFHFEGSRRMRIADAGIAELRQHVDTMIVIPNQNLFRVASEKTTFSDAFLLADQVLYSGIACIVDLIIKDGLINLDFADVRTVMKGMGTAMMGTGEAAGDDRARRAAEEAIANPLLEEVSMKGAKGLLLSITGGQNLTLYEVDQAATRVRKEVDPDANIVVGATFDESLNDRVRVSIVASGMPAGASMPRADDAWAQYAHARPAGDRTQATPGTYAAPGARDAIDVDMLKQRLSEAMQSTPSRQSGPEPPHRQRAVAPREIWHAPGGVRIEAEPGRANGHSGGLPAEDFPVERGHPTGYSGTSGFTPAAPMQVPAHARRFPELPEFPEVGQRAYRGQLATSGSRPSDKMEAARRTGFFQRLKSRWSTTNDESRSDRSAPPVESDGRAIRGGYHSLQQALERPSSGHPDTNSTPAQSADKTMFSKRTKR